MAALVLTVLVAVLHVVFFVVESLLWTTPNVRKRFGMSKEDAETTKVLAQNQGIYNLALAAALGWAVFAHERNATLVLLGFVVFVGIYGGFTAKRSILVIQAAPALIALGLTYANV